MISNCSAGEGSWESLGQQEDQTSQSWRKSTLNIHWKDCCWGWGSSALTTSCEEPTHWKRSWWWERLRPGGEEGNRGCNGWMASSTQWTWVWANSGKQWRTRRLGMLQSLGSQRARHDWAIEQQQQQHSQLKNFTSFISYTLDVLLTNIPWLPTYFLSKHRYSLTTWQVHAHLPTSPDFSLNSLLLSYIVYILLIKLISRAKWTSFI